MTPEAKDEHLVAVARELFVARGLEVPMSEVACAAGVGVASIYRRFPSKHDLLAAVVTRRMDAIAGAALDAATQPGDRFEVLAELIHSLVEGQSADDFIGEAQALVADDPGVQASTAHASAAMEALLASARDEGRVRSDATMLDLRLLFAATRAAKRVEPGQWPRMLELMLDALEARPARP